MKILHESPECYIQQCRECGAVLQYSKNDIYIRDKVHLIGNDTFCATIDYIRCPACEKMIPATKEWFYDQFSFKNP